MDDLYTIVLHRGGKFVSEPHLKYVGGEIEAWEMVDIDKLSITELEYYFQQHGYNIDSYKKVYWLESGFEFEDGLRVFETDEDIHWLYASAKAVNKNELEFYFDHHLLDDTNGKARPVDGIRDDNIVSSVAIDITEVENAIKDLTLDVSEEDDDCEGFSDDDDDREGLGHDDDEPGDDDDSEGSYESYSDGSWKLGPEDAEDDRAGDNAILETNYHGKSSRVRRKRAMDEQVHHVERDEVATRAEAYENFFERDEYHSEEEGIDNGDDDKNAEDVTRLIQFNKDATFGQVHLELEMVFPTLNLFEMVVRDYNIALGRPVKMTLNSNRCKFKYKVKVCQMKIYRALHIDREIVEGSKKELYAMLHDYCAELRRSNIGSTCGLGVQRVNLSQPPYFEKLYICLDATKKWFLTGCRPLIGLDGCHLKGYYGGQLLTAVAQDGNHSFYVIVYAVVEQETKETWSWLLTRLFLDIGDHVIHGWEIMSNMQKGLLPAIKELALGCTHRYCVRHLETNLWKN
ncbi:hypothetical protein CRG98_017963 [Punica granatum]|uniref:Uncharacterized protein n=1 Tax=Punica granatum TaxID=22663 RepID=A0A2I0JZA7_PUNGR|nr:hypothetical protein CRG98_017963 [Punica granatum]